MPFFQPAFFAPVQADNTAFANLFQLLNDVDAYQRNAAYDAARPKQQQQQQKSQQKVQAKPQQKIQDKPQDNNNTNNKVQEKPQPESQTQLKQQTVRHPLEDFLNSFQQSVAEVNRATASLPSFSPRFDVRETQNTYELHGELAGVERNNISLEFSEPQTLVVSGKVERNYSSPVPAVDNTPEAIADTHSEHGADNGDDHDHDHASETGARTPVDDEFTSIASPRSPSPARSHRATVTDEETEEALERGEAVEENNKETTVVKTPTQNNKNNSSNNNNNNNNNNAAPAERYWHRERTIGQFKRVFTFPVPVDEANVRASLENGILSVSVPKIKRETRRIPVF